jgi:ABC-type spermidine/putrescine transport system permease subunit I
VNRDTTHQKKVFPALSEAIAKYFGSRSRSIQRDLNELFRVGRHSLVIGVGTLIACLLLAQFVARFLHEALGNRLIEESFLILGWVANWRPLEIFLYDWWPLARRRDLYQRIADAKIEEQPY